MNIDEALYRRLLQLQRLLDETEREDERWDLELELHEVEEALRYEKPTENLRSQRIVVG